MSPAIALRSLEQTAVDPRIVMMSTFPPTQCGIATFAQSLSQAMTDAGSPVDVVQLTQEPTFMRPATVAHQHRSSADTVRTAQVLNSYDVIVLQHEFGIYGGDDGIELVDLLNSLRVPVITVIHTVLKTPTLRQRSIIQSLIAASSALVTMTNIARKNLISHYQVAPEMVHVIPHGAPDLRRSGNDPVSTAGPRLLTWGLISRGKGIEWGIEALAKLADVYPQVEYVVAGRTHPNVVAYEGERYRESLVQLALDLGVSDRLHLVNEYLDSDALAELIASASMFLLPYDSKDQVTSGVLAEAMVAGGPVIATRFPHAIEVLGRGAGVLVEHQNSDDIAAAVRRIHHNPAQAAQMRSLTAEMSLPYLWPAVGRSYMQLADMISNAHVRPTSLAIA
ncbi:MAG TPA: glycosyl transferase family 1 [Actinobacteria bacterium]|nr:glycosyl transferase family 1 [Actinomycetota bacterium]